MPRIMKRKEHPLSIRLPEADIAMIDHASLCGRSRTDLVRDAAGRAAEDVLTETSPIRMSPTRFKAFMAARIIRCGAGNGRTVPSRISLGTFPDGCEVERRELCATALSPQSFRGARLREPGIHRASVKVGRNGSDPSQSLAKWIPGSFAARMPRNDGGEILRHAQL